MNLEFAWDEEIMGGALCFAGTRIPVKAVFSFCADGFDVGEILREFPTLTFLQVSGAKLLYSNAVVARAQREFEVAGAI